jgi:hypothetical protein
MQMINVMKRLAELDAANPNVIKESQVEECGMTPMMGEMGAMSPQPQIPASMNLTAGTGDELAGMLATIMQLAGVNKEQPTEPEIGGDVDILSAEPEVGGIETDGGGMRAMIDKLNPSDDDSGGTEFGDDGVSKAHGDQDNDGDHDMDDHDVEKDQGDEEEGPEQDDSEKGDDGSSEKTDENMYDNTPDESIEGYGAFANHGDLAKNSPGGGNVPKDHDSRPRVRNQPVATFENLMKEYKSFIGESDNTDPDVEEDMEEGIEDRLKDLDPKNPVNQPAYQRKAKSGDSASAAKNTKESIELADMLKIAGIK